MREPTDLELSLRRKDATHYGVELNERRLGRQFGIYHSDAFVSAAYSRDARRIVTASEDGTARQWLANDDDLALAARCRIWRNLTVTELQRYGLELPTAFSFTDRQCPPVYSWQPDR